MELSLHHHHHLHGAKNIEGDYDVCKLSLAVGLLLLLVALVHYFNSTADGH